MVVSTSIPNLALFFDNLEKIGKKPISTDYDRSSAECKKVVSDIFDEIEFLMDTHILHYFQILSPFIFQNIKQNVFKNATYDPIALIFDKCV